MHEEVSNVRGRVKTYDLLAQIDFKRWSGSWRVRLVHFDRIYFLEIYYKHELVRKNSGKAVEKLAGVYKNICESAWTHQHQHKF